MAESTIFMDKFKDLKFFQIIHDKISEIDKITVDNKQYKLTKDEIINLYKEKFILFLKMKN